MTTFEFRVVGVTHGFTLSGNGTIPYTFDDWITPTTGDSAIYDFESDDEGFTVSGTGCLEYTFQNPMDTGANC